MTRKLLHLPIPFDDESPGSILLRASESNGWKSPTALLLALNYKHSNQSGLSLQAIFCNKERWKYVCELFGNKDNELNYKNYPKNGISERSNVDFMGISIPWVMLRLKSPAICPWCIKENNYQKSIWDFKLITACSKHKIKLVESCPNCNKALTWNRKKISICPCGFELKDCLVENIDVKGIKIIECLIKNINNDSISMVCEYSKIYKEFFELVAEPVDKHLITTISVFSVTNDNYMRATLLSYLKKFFLLYGLHPRTLLAPFLCSKDKRILINTQKTLICLKNKLPLKTKIPTVNISMKFASASIGIKPHITREIFQKHLNVKKVDGRFIQKKLTIKIINDFLNSLIQGSSKIVEDHSFIPISSSNEKIHVLIPKLLNGDIQYSADQIISKGLTGIKLIKRPIKNYLNDDYSYLSLKETAHLCNVQYENIRFAVACGALVRVDSKKTKGTKIFVEKKVANEFNKLYIFSGTLALQYKCNPRTLSEKLISIGIKPFSGPKVDGGLIYLFKREDVNHLNLRKIDAIRNYPTNTGQKKKHNTSNEDNSIPYATAARTLNVSVQKIKSLVSRGVLIENKDINRRKSLTHESFNKIFDIVNDRKSKKLKDVANELDQTEREFTLRYVNTNLIERIETSSGYYLTEKEYKKAKAFNKKYVTSKEGGKLIGANSSYLTNLKRIKKIKTAKQIGHDHRKISFFSRKEVLALKRKS